MIDLAREPVEPSRPIDAPRARICARRRARQQQGEDGDGDSLSGSWGSIRSAADLAGTTEAKILNAILEGQVRKERRGSILFVSLSDVAKLAPSIEKGGDS
jgi:hypothetical protein